MRDELSKVVDLGTLQMAGTVSIGLGSKGDLLAQNVADRKATVGLSVHADNVEVSGMEGTPPLRQPRLRADVNATVFGGERSFVERIEGLCR